MQKRKEVKHFRFAGQQTGTKGNKQEVENCKKLLCESYSREKHRYTKDNIKEVGSTNKEQQAKNAW